MPSQDVVLDYSGSPPSPKENMVLDSDDGEEVIIPPIQTPIMIESTHLETVHEMEIEEDVVSEIKQDEMEIEDEVVSHMPIATDTGDLNERAVMSGPISPGVFGVTNGALKKDLIADSAMEACIEKAPKQIIEIEETEIIEYVLEEGDSMTPIIAPGIPIVAPDDISDISVILPLDPILEEDEEVVAEQGSPSITELQLPGSDLYTEIMNEVEKSPDKDVVPDVTQAIVPDFVVQPFSLQKKLGLDDAPVRHSTSDGRPAASALEAPKYRKRYVRVCVNMH